MQTKIIILFALVSVFPSLVLAQDSQWLVRLKQINWMGKVGKINVLKTTRAEVEEILGKPRVIPDRVTNYIEVYDIENGRVMVRYTTEGCESKSNKFKPDLVKNILFTPDADVHLSKLKLPLKQFKTSKFRETLSTSFENKSAGIEIVVDDESKKVAEVNFFPSDEVKCPNSW